MEKTHIKHRRTYACTHIRIAAQDVCHCSCKIVHCSGYFLKTV